MRERRVGSQRVHKITERRAPGFADGRIAARQRNVAEMRAALESSIRSCQEFAAPDRAIGAISRAIECDADDITREAVLEHATGDVCVVMLDCKLRQREFERVSG